MESDYEAVFQHHGLLTSIVGLNFKILPRHFVEGRMVVRCVSTIYNNKNSIVENKLALLIDKREAFFQGIRSHENDFVLIAFAKSKNFIFRFSRRKRKQFRRFEVDNCRGTHDSVFVTRKGGFLKNGVQTRHLPQSKRIIAKFDFTEREKKNNEMRKTGLW